MELLGASLVSTNVAGKGTARPVEYTAAVAMEALAILEAVHNRG